MNSPLVDALNSIGWNYERRIQELEEENKELREQLNKWISQSVKQAQESSDNLLKAVFAGLSIAE